MAYFLGYRYYAKYIPIKLIDADNNVIPNNILDIVKFTNSFVLEKDLKDYLINKGLIDNSSVELVYLIEKGKKGSKTYEPIKMGKTLYLADSVNFFNSNHILSYIHSKCYDADFISHIFAFYLKKMGLLSTIQDKIKRDSQNLFKFKNLIEDLLKKDISKNLKRILKNLLDIIDGTYDATTNTFQNLNSSEELSYINFVDEIYYALTDNDVDAITLYYYMLNKVDLPNIPCIGYLKSIYSIMNYMTDIGIESYSSSRDEQQDIHSFWTSFFKSIVYIYDSKNKDYKYEGTKLKIQKRNLVDLGMFLYNYETYLREINKRTSSPSINVEDIEDDYEEFLEEEDFLRNDTTSESEGYNLKLSDSKGGCIKYE